MALHLMDETAISEDGAARLLLVEDHASVRQAMAFLFQAEPEFTVVAQAGTLAEAREAMSECEGLDVAVVDLGLPDGDGVDLIGELCEMDVSVLVLSASVNHTEFAQAIEAGAAGGLHKSADIEEVVDAVRRLRAGEALLAPHEVIEMLRTASKERQRDREIRRAFEQLTPRELEILAALAEGLDSSQIARKLRIRIATERTHMVNVLNKLGVHSRLEALALAARHGFVEFR